MKIILDKGSIYVIRFDQGEEVIETIKKICFEKNMEAGFFFGLGAARELVLSHYDIDRKQYNDTPINEDLEIAGIFGNVTRKDGEVYIHAHGSFSDKNFKTYAGHVKKVIVSGTCEIVLEMLHEPILREHDSKSGLNLLK